MEHAALVGRVFSVAASIWLALVPGSDFNAPHLDWELPECKEQGAADRASLHICRWAFGVSSVLLLVLAGALLRKVFRLVPDKVLVSTSTQTDGVETRGREVAHRDCQLLGVRPERRGGRRRGVVE